MVGPTLQPSLGTESKEGLLCPNEWHQNTARAPGFSAVDSRAQALGLWMYPGLTPAIPHLHMPTQPPRPLLKQDFLPFQHKGGLMRVFKDLTRKVTDKILNSTTRSTHTPVVADIWHEDKVP